MLEPPNGTPTVDALNVTDLAIGIRRLTAGRVNRLAGVQALVVTNLYPSPSQPRLGRFVADQVEALRSLGAEVEVFTFGLGARSYLPAVRALSSRLAEKDFDVVHAHYGLCGWVAARAGASPLAVTFHGTDIRHPAVGRISRHVARRAQLAAGVSRSCFRREGGRRGLPTGPNSAVLPCGVDTDRFRPLDRQDARRTLGLDPAGRYLLFPADPGRPVKRVDRARAVAEAADATLLTAGSVAPDEMPTLINASSGVLVPSESEGFGLAVLEAIACGVPAISTPVGIAPALLDGLDGCLVSDFEPQRWAVAARAAIERNGEPIDAAVRVTPFSARRMAERVLTAWKEMAGQRERSSVSHKVEP